MAEFTVEDRIKEAHISIMRHKKFCAFGPILACGRTTTTLDIPTACTDGWNVKYNPEFIKEYANDKPTLRFLVLHEQMHKAYRHMQVWVGLFKENPTLANIAADHFVNLAIVDLDANEGFARMLSVGIQPDAKYRGWNVRMIYEDLKKNPPPKKGKGSGDKGDGMDEHDWEGEGAGDQDAQSEAQKATEIERAIRQGEIIRKMRSATGTGNGDGVFGDLLAPRIDWKKLLRDFITETCAGRDETSWKRPNRRFMDMGVFMPGWQGTTMRELVVGMDTSGSCFGSDEMTRFVSEITGIIETVKPSIVRCVYWDTKVTGCQTFQDGQFAVNMLHPKGGGGTNGEVLFDYIRAQKWNPDAVVQLTDGFVGSWGRSEWPTLFAVTSDEVSPFGTTIKLEL